MEKILVNENIIRQSEAMADVKETIQIINSELREALKEIGVNKLSMETIVDCIMASADQTGTNYFKSVKKDLDGIATFSIRKQYAYDAEYAFDAFRDKLNQIRPRVKHIGFLTIENDICVLTPENESRLLDSLKIYISDNREVEVYKRHKAAADALNVLFAGEFPMYWFNLFVCENGEIKVNENTNYSKFVNNGTK